MLIDVADGPMSFQCRKGIQDVKKVAAKETLVWGFSNDNCPSFE
jgi:hypothetical protein